MTVVQIPGVKPSQVLRDELRGETVILAFSRGKDSVAAWLALREAGVEVLPYHMYLVPDLAFVDKSLSYFAEWFGCGPILNLPHPSLYRWLSNLVYQSPERCGVIERCGLVVPDYEDMNPIVREHFGLPPDTWVCNGVRAADSPNRRMAISQPRPGEPQGRHTADRVGLEDRRRPGGDRRSWREAASGLPVVQSQLRRHRPQVHREAEDLRS